MAFCYMADFEPGSTWKKNVSVTLQFIHQEKSPETPAVVASAATPVTPRTTWW
jgi:hypothetical protein